MKKVIQAALFLIAATHLLLAGVDPAAQQLLVAAEQQADLFSRDAGPFQLEVDFGSVGEIQLIGSSANSMDDATLQTLKGWKFKPAMCGAEPVVSDIEVVVSFRLE